MPFGIEIDLGMTVTLKQYPKITVVTFHLVSACFFCGRFYLVTNVRGSLNPLKRSVLDACLLHFSGPTSTCLGIINTGANIGQLTMH